MIGLKQQSGQAEIVCRGEGDSLQGGAEGERQQGRGQDEEKCWFKGVEGEEWIRQSSTLPEAKQR